MSPRRRLPALARSAIASILLLWTAAQGAASTPRDVIQQTTEQVIVVIDQDGVDSWTKIQRIEEIAADRFDFATIARLVLAQSWKKLSPAQRDDFTREFQKHLSVTYGRNIDNYADQKVAITGDREEPRGDWTVQTKIVGNSPADEILVDYRLRKADGGEWKVIDVVVERVSLVSNFRSQLRELISSRGIDRTLTLLREKNASGESILPEEERTPKSAKR